MNKVKKLVLLVLMLVLCLSLAGCRKPYDKPEFAKISPSQTGFLIPLVGDSSSQSAFASEELLAEHKVATKEVQIPHRWVQMGRMSWNGEWKPSAELIVVERKPVSRSWDSGDDTASSSNRAIFGGSSDNIGIYVGMNCTATITLLWIRLLITILKSWLKIASTLKLLSIPLLSWAPIRARSWKPSRSM